MSFEDNRDFQKKNFTGAPMDRIRSSTFSALIEAAESGYEFTEAVMMVESSLYFNRSDIREKWKLSDDEIEEAKNMGITMARAYLKIPPIL